ncbi:mavicyanin-like [Prosopis cineraria]|uniref:mavicyanin-like n=1 Tax=Prosopis cineraria TaxID=364024 RepID=UPI00241046B7|nr:mavicyanin-like [Prosopis cineraria]
MAKLMMIVALLFHFGFVIMRCSATNYVVGDNSGWDISSNLGTWVQDKKFNVGDVLLFQYSSSDSVDEVTRENYKTCNTNKVLATYGNGNTSVPLTKPGDRYFVSGNKLYCLGGMKLHVHVQGNSANSPAQARARSMPVAGPVSATSGKTTASQKNTPLINGAKNSGTDATAMLVLMVASVSWIFQI